MRGDRSSFRVVRVVGFARRCFSFVDERRVVVRILLRFLRVWTGVHNVSFSFLFAICLGVEFEVGVLVCDCDWGGGRERTLRANGTDIIV